MWMEVLMVMRWVWVAETFTKKKIEGDKIVFAHK